MRARRWLIFAGLAIGFFFVALNGDIYNLTSPPTWSWHVLLRKSYSIVAFMLVGGALIRASGSSLALCVVAIALYSGAIEIAQHVLFGHEPLVWNAIDVVCGGIGGALAWVSPWFRAR